ncbi:MAG: antibiotic biosynthesis monooxygenase [Microbacteriaceae bacterium]|jgi:quinol monooxygenase YgiN|nr:antibiotic biosynthesis monooxygenase [Microbacteriaceae bacterium]
MTALQVIAYYSIAPGNEKAVIDLLPQLAEASRTEPGNLSYNAYIQLGDESEVVILEQYESPEAFAAHRESEHFQRLGFGAIIPMLANRRVETFPIPAE